ncbi:OprD family outer membrane porin [Shewanella algae]|uniref:OprD family outer membrane porin n=1 Tax=Shewanella algae TaxID=38313 RepID=UPI0031F4F787
MMSNKKLSVLALSLICSTSAFANEPASSFDKWFSEGSFHGAMKSYYFVQTFDKEGSHQSQIWANGGNIVFSTAELNGFELGGEFQGSYITSRDDPDGKTAGSMDADGAVLSESYLKYTLGDTTFKGGRQHFSSPFVADSGSRLIKESFEMYQIRNKSLLNTEISAGYVTKYQTRTDKSYYRDNDFVKFEQNGIGRPGGFYDIGDSGMWFTQINTSLSNEIRVKGQYADVIGEVKALYADVKYTLPIPLKSYIAAQLYTNSWDNSDFTNNNLFGVKFGANHNDLEFFAAITTVSGSAGEYRVFRGVGQGAYSQFTKTTKTAGVAAFEAGTDSYQLGVGYRFNQLDGKLRVTSFDNPEVGKDLDEWTLNLVYGFVGDFKNCIISVDFTVLDYENNDKDATDLRAKFTYKF